MRPPVVHAGDTYGILTVQMEVEHSKPGRKYLCVCACGKSRMVTAANLKRGSTLSCGCLRGRRKGDGRTHGHATAGAISPTYRSWAAMRKRCLRPQCPAFKWYGGIGIQICPEWDSYEQFLEDMGPKPVGLSLDRIDPFGHYEPRNCRWADAKTQARNQRRYVKAAQPSMTKEDLLARHKARYARIMRREVSLENALREADDDWHAAHHIRKGVQPPGWAPALARDLRRAKEDPCPSVRSMDEPGGGGTDESGAAV